MRVRTTADGVVVGETEHPLAAGTNEIEWSLDIDRPRLWWPRALGDQPLTDIDVDLLVDGEVSDRRSRRTGLREVAWNDWVCSINGERLFLKGANVLPTRPGLADAKPAEVRRDVELAVEAGLDALRVQAHIADPELYRAADELGVLLLQDFPLQWGYARQIRREAMRQAREAVNALGHHPSIVQWCAHDEPVADAPQVEADGRAGGCAASSPSSCRRGTSRCSTAGSSGRSSRPTRPARPSPTAASSRTCPSSTAPTATSGSAGTAATSASSPSGPACCPASCASSASSAPSPCPTRPTAVRRHVGAGRDLDWEDLREHHGLEVDVMSGRVPPADHPTFGAGGRRPSATRRRCCATTSRRCAG